LRQDEWFGWSHRKTSYVKVTDTYSLFSFIPYFFLSFSFFPSLFLSILFFIHFPFFIFFVIFLSLLVTHSGHVQFHVLQIFAQRPPENLHTCMTLVHLYCRTRDSQVKRMKRWTQSECLP
jgi:hypothetical protein